MFDDNQDAREINNFLLNTLSVTCGLQALKYSLSSIRKEDADKIKENIIDAWKIACNDYFQERISKYNDFLSTDKVKGNVDLLPQPEEMQKQFNTAIALCEQTARNLMW